MLVIPGGPPAVVEQTSHGSTCDLGHAWGTKAVIAVIDGICTVRVGLIRAKR